MSATNELRRLLDTLGVEYYPKAADETVFSTGTEHVHVQDDLIDGCLELFIRPVTPQQAVEATLGRGTCRDCKHFRSHGDDYLFCDLAARELDGGDGFCSWGERRDA